MSDQLSQNALAVLQKRYFKDGEDWERLCKRVSNALTADPKLQEKYFDMIYNLDVLPNTPTLINAGTELQQLSACYVLPVGDDIVSIFDAVKNAAIIHKSGGGTGFSFSNLREAGSKVKSTSGISSGPVSFMRVFNEATGAIKQGGVRRGANMGILDISHPDIEEFIACKADTKQLTNFNISVGITDEFMEKAINKKQFNLVSPHTGEVVKEVDAERLLQMIAEYAHKNGEPGVIFLDTIEEANPTPHLGRIKATNPCFAGYMRLLTANGRFQFRHILREVEIIGGDGKVHTATIQKTGEKHCVELILSDHEKIVCTPDHVFLANGISPTKAEDMLMKKLTPHLTRVSHERYDKYLAYGFAQGDGNMTRLNSSAHTGIEINIGALDADVVRKVKSFSTLRGSGRARYWPNVKDELIARGFCPKTLPERVLPTKFHNCFDGRETRAFLCGLFSANGSVISDSRVALKTTCRELAEEVRSALRAFEISSYITTNKEKKVKFSNGEYVCKTSYDLNIGRYSSILAFSQIIGFLQDYKTEKLKTLLSKRAPKVVAINYLEKPIGVYDFSMPSCHWGVVEGYVAHNCGEIPLLPNEACNLASINLNHCITSHGIDKEKLIDLTTFAVLMLNDIIDANKYPLKEIQEAVKKTRKIGLGVMGFADILTKLDIPYASHKGILMASDIMSTVAETAGEVSEYLGKVIGVYPECNGVARTNATLTCIAPTGSISMIADCSSGIEPLFSLAYTKTVIDGESMMYVNNTLKQKLESMALWTPKIEKHIMSTGSIQAIPDIPREIKEVFRTAQEIPLEWHIKMQATFQKYVDNAVSKTINLRSDATVEDVMFAYKLAWEQKCKGITVYRDGSRESQVLSIGYSPKDIKYHKCPECSAKVEHVEGCVTCMSCGWSVCGG